jgi:peptidase E
MQNELSELIAVACSNTPAFTKQRSKELSRIKWRLRYGLLYAGLDAQLNCILTDADNAQIFDARDNEQMKRAFYGAALNCKFDVELCAS